MTPHNFEQFLTHPPPIVTHFITKALVLLSQILDPLPPKTVPSFMDDPLGFYLNFNFYFYFFQFTSKLETQFRLFFIDPLHRLHFVVFGRLNSKSLFAYKTLFCWSQLKPVQMLLGHIHQVSKRDKREEKS